MRMSTVVQYFDEEMRHSYGENWYNTLPNELVRRRAHVFVNRWGDCFPFTKGNMIVRLQKRHTEKRLEELLDG